MNKKELVENVAKKAGVKKEIAKLVVDTLLEVIMEELALGRRVKWTGLGEFFVAQIDFKRIKMMFHDITQRWECSVVPIRCCTPNIRQGRRAE